MECDLKRHEVSSRSGERHKASSGQNTDKGKVRFIINSMGGMANRRIAADGATSGSSKTVAEKIGRTDARARVEQRARLCLMT